MDSPPSSTSARRDILIAANEWFGSLAGWCFDYRWFVIALFLGIGAGALALVSGARIDNSYEAYFDPSDKSYQAYEQYREDFGSDEVSYILYEVPGVQHGPWNIDVMRRIVDLTSALEDEVPFVYDVKTLANAELTQGVPDGIEIQKISDDFPETQAELLELRDAYLRKHLLVGGILSEDATHAAIIIKMDRSSTDPPELIRLDPEKGDDLENLYPQATDSAIESILARPEYAGIEFYHSGDVPLNSVYNRIIGNETQKLDLITSGVIALILLLTFRSFLAAIAPIVVVQISVFMCIGLIGLIGWKLDMSFGSAPTLLTAIGVAHSVHILSEFRTQYRLLGDRRASLVKTLYLVGAPCLLTSLTTAVGFGAMTTAPIMSISHSGVYNAFGVMAAFVMSLTLLMALLSMGRRELAGIAAVLGVAIGFVLPGAEASTAIASLSAVALAGVFGVLVLQLFERKSPAESTSKGGVRVKRALAALARFVVRNRRGVLVGFGGLALVSIVGMSRLVVDSNWLDDFSSDVPLKAIVERVDTVMGGTSNIIYLFDSGEPDGIKNPEVLREMDRLQQIGNQHSIVRKSYSLVDILKDLNQAFHADDPAYHAIPETRQLVAQYLLLYEMSGGEQAEEYVSTDYRRASVEFRLALEPTSKTAALVEAIDEELADGEFEASTVSLTGIGALWIKLLDYIVSSQVRSFLTAFGVIAVMMVLIFRSLGTGLISMVPNLAPVFFTIGIMGWAGIPLDYSKVMIAAVAIGIAVDDTIHLVLRYRHEFLVHGSYADALEASLSDVGRALMITSLALVCGFLVLTLSVLDSQAMFGVLLATTIIVALLADFFLMPALVLTFKPFGPEGARDAAARTELEEAA